MTLVEIAVGVGLVAGALLLANTLRRPARPARAKRGDRAYDVNDYDEDLYEPADKTYHADEDIGEGGVGNYLTHMASRGEDPLLFRKLKEQRAGRTLDRAELQAEYEKEWAKHKPLREQARFAVRGDKKFKRSKRGDHKLSDAELFRRYVAGDEEAIRETNRRSREERAKLLAGDWDTQVVGGKTISTPKRSNRGDHRQRDLPVAQRIMRAGNRARQYGPGGLFASTDAPHATAARDRAMQRAVRGARSVAGGIRPCQGRGQGSNPCLRTHGRLVP